MSDNVNAVQVDAVHEHMTNGGKWTDLSEPEIVAYVTWLVDNARANGRQEGAEAAKETMLAQTLTAETERLNRSIQAFDASLAATPTLTSEEV